MHTAKTMVGMCFFCATAVFSQLSSVPRQQTWVTNGTVYAITVAGDKIYIGGSFTTVGPSTRPDSVSRRGLACIDAATGIATAWNPNVNGSVRVISVIGSKVYIGGLFDTIGTQRKRNIACLDTGTGQPTRWDPNADSRGGSVLTLCVNGNKLYVGGGFDSIGGRVRNGLACIDTGTGLATAWNPATNSTANIKALSVNGAKVYVGGRIYGLGHAGARGGACLDTGTAQATAWNPVTGGFLEINALLVNEDKIFLGGLFSTIRSIVRNSIACVDTILATPTSWNPNALGSWTSVNSMFIHGAQVYAGGFFTSIGGQVINNIACLDSGTGLATNWNPNANEEVFAIAVHGTKVYIGGMFTTIGGNARPYFAEFRESLAPAITAQPNVSCGSATVSTSGFANGRGIISYTLPDNVPVSICIYDTKGRVLVSEANLAHAAGNHTVRLSGDGLGAGIYVLKFRAGTFETSQRITIVR